MCLICILREIAEKQEQLDQAATPTRQATDGEQVIPAGTEDRNVYIHFFGARATGKTMLANDVQKALSDLNYDVDLRPDGDHDVLAVISPADGIIDRAEARNQAASAPIAEAGLVDDMYHISNKAAALATLVNALVAAAGQNEESIVRALRVEILALAAK